MYIYTYIYVYIYIYGNRQNYGKKNVQLRQAAPASDFIHNWVFPHKGSKYPGSDPNLFFLIDFSCKIRGLGQIDRFFHNYFFHNYFFP